MRRFFSRRLATGLAKTQPQRLRRRVLTFEPLEDRRLLALTPNGGLTTGTHLTTYTVAIAATGEFTQSIGGKAAAMSAINQVVTELNKIFEAELAVSLQLHSQNDRLIFEDPNTDGYTNGLVSQMIDENPGRVNQALNGSAGNANGYDFGHVLGTGDDGGIGGTAQKASGATNFREPINILDYVSLLAHEFGHQMSASHSFNGSSGNCGPNRDPSSAYEPGSGSTIMSYQDSCPFFDADPNHNVPKRPGDGFYFHAASFDQIMTFLNGQAASRGTKTATNNNIPIVTGGPNRTIPASTPFELTASATDADTADKVTFTWEQLDLATMAVGVPIPNALDGAGPLFRSLAPSSSPTRTFPLLEDLLANTPPNQNRNDHLPTQSRDLNFRVTVRDNHAVNGKPVSGVTSRDVRLSVVNTGAPFRVSSHNTAQTIAGGSRQTITWDVAGTTGSGINTSQIDIRMSLDGGLTYPVLLAAKSANDGSEEVTIPNVFAARARLRVEADRTQNVFFDINDADLRVEQDTSAPGGVIVTQSNGTTRIAEGGAVQLGTPSTDSFTLGLTQPPIGNVELTVTADPQTEVSLDGTTFGSTQTVLFSPANATSKTITVRAVNDNVAEGFHTGRIRQAVTQSADPKFSTAVLTNDVIASVVVEITDDEAVPLIGVDFDFGVPNGLSPASWNQIDNPFQVSITNAVRENLQSSEIDLSFTIHDNGGGIQAGFGSSTLATSSFPKHTPSLDSVGDVIYWEDVPVTASFSDLKPNQRYNVYVFSAGANVSFSQTVTITGRGADNPTPFQQSSSAHPGKLIVNTAPGSSANDLEGHALTVTSTTDGKIHVRLDPATGSKSVLAALAIQEVLQPIPQILVEETGGKTEVTDAPTTDTVSVTLSRSPAANVVINVSSSNPNEAAVDASILTFTSLNWNVPQTIMISGVSDGAVDGNKTIPISFAVDVILSDPGFAIAVARQVSVNVIDSNAPPRPWQNPNKRHDVSGDNRILANDILILITELNTPQFIQSDNKLPTARPTNAFFYDVDGNGYLTSHDILHIIDLLNQGGGGEAESQRPPTYFIDSFRAVLPTIARKSILGIDLNSISESRTGFSNGHHVSTFIDKSVRRRYVDFIGDLDLETAIELLASDRTNWG